MKLLSLTGSYKILAFNFALKSYSLLANVRFLALCEAKTKERISYLFLFILFLALRMPEVILHGRVWAEEGACFIRNALIMPWTEAIFQPVGGYLNLIANLAGIIAAKLVSLETARFVGPITGLLFQTIPAILVAFSPIRWLQSRINIILALLLIATAPQAEVWLNFLHPQFHLTLCVALILSMPIAYKQLTRMMHLMLVFLASICGPTTWFLFPLFAIRTLNERSLSRLYQALALLTGLLLQLIFFYDSHQTSHEPITFISLTYSLFTQTLILPFTYAGFFVEPLMQLQQANNLIASMLAVLFFTVEVGLILLGLRYLWKLDRSHLFWLYTSGIVIAVISYAFARGGTLSLINNIVSRYAFLPYALFALTLLGLANLGSNNIRKIAQISIFLMLLKGMIHFSPSAWFLPTSNWLEEIAAWRKDHAYIIKIPPAGWTVDLTKIN